MIVEQDLKIRTEYFEAVKSKAKLFEIRKDDRDYKVGYFIRLLEIESDGKTFTGRYVFCRITYILRDAEKYGLKKGFCILGIKIENL